jgi:hypothetical protein
MADEDQRLLEEAKQSREENQELREAAGHETEDPGKAPPQQAATDGPDGEPWAKTSSGDADDVTDDD